MASTAIKANSNDFLATQSRQATIINAMINLANTQQTVFQTMANAWYGGSGAAFRAGMVELQREVNAGIFMIKTLNNQTTASHTMFLQADKDAANVVAKLQTKK